MVAVIVAMLAGCAAGDDDVDQLYTDAPIDNEADQPLHYEFQAVAPDGTGWSGSSVHWAEDKTEESFGTRLCVDEGRTVTITSVEPIKVLGDVEALPALVMTFDKTHTFFLSADGYPPELEDGDALTPVGAATVTAGCGGADDTFEELPDTQQGLVIGLRRVGAAGGGWRGFRINYTVDGEEHWLEIPVEMYMCGKRDGLTDAFAEQCSKG